VEVCGGTGLTATNWQVESMQDEPKLMQLAKKCEHLRGNQDTRTESMQQKPITAGTMANYAQNLTLD